MGRELWYGVAKVKLKRRVGGSKEEHDSIVGGEGDLFVKVTSSFRTFVEYSATRGDKGLYSVVVCPNGSRAKLFRVNGEGVETFFRSSVLSRLEVIGMGGLFTRELWSFPTCVFRSNIRREGVAFFVPCFQVNVISLRGGNGVVKDFVGQGFFRVVQKGNYSTSRLLRRVGLRLPYVRVTRLGVVVRVAISKVFLVSLIACFLRYLRGLPIVR